MTNNVDHLQAELERMELLEEALADAQLQLEDRGWERLGAFGNETEFDRPYLDRASRQCRASAVINPLIRRAVALRVAYIWGQGVHIQADDGAETSGQDVNAVVQGFLDDPSNLVSFTGSQAREELERALATDGNVFLALPTSPLSGRVQVRSVPFAEIADIIRNPDDSDDVWFFQRTRTVAPVEPGQFGLTVAPTQTETVYHPRVGFRPRQRPKTIDGHPILWDQPVVHVCVNRLDGWKYGIGDVYAAIGWARGYSEFLQDWAKLGKALAKVAWSATAKTKAGAANVRQRMTTATEAGSTVTTAPDQRIEAVNKSGATIDANSGRPLASMVAAATDLPVTMLLSDPGVTGARATAETLDRPLELLMMMRQSLWAHATRTVLDHVIDAAVRAPQGPLRGTITTDPVTGLDKVALLGDQSRLVVVQFPPLDQQDPAQRVAAIKTADDTGKLPPELVARLLMQTLGVDNIDDLIAGMLDDNGDWVDPADATAARSALAAVKAGGFPTGKA